VSHIAAALAKSKGKKVPLPPPESLNDLPALRLTPPPNPFLPKPGTADATPTPAQAAATVVPAQQPARKRTRLIVAALVTTAALGLTAWFLLKSDLPPPPAPTKATPAAPLAKSLSVKGEATVNSHSPVLSDRVRTMPITAAAGGGSQRLSVAGKIYEPGETVAEGLVLQSIENDQIVFRDAEGNLYTRRL
jgi:hypothetical protein